VRRVCAPLTPRHGGDLRSAGAIEATQVVGNRVLPFDDAHPLKRGYDLHLPTDVSMRDAVIVQVKAQVRVLRAMASATRSSVGKGLSGNGSKSGRSSANTARTLRSRSSGQPRRAASSRHQVVAWAFRSRISLNWRQQKIGRAQNVSLVPRALFRSRARLPPGAVGTGNERPTPRASDGSGLPRRGVPVLHF